MNEYFNALEGTIQLPVPGGLGVRTLAPGQSFYGPSGYYDKFIMQGMLAKVSSTTGTIRGFVAATDQSNDPNSSLADSSGAARYKSNAAGGLDSLRNIKYQMHLSIDTKPGDNVMVLYYFYTLYSSASTASHVIPRYEPMIPGWSFPTWAPLPSNFYSLGPVEQMTALMQTA